jgi:hypothetical protein
MDLVDMNAVKCKLESMRCHQCDQHPTVSISGDSFKINCCCQEFKQNLAQIANDEIAAQAKKALKTI